MKLITELYKDTQHILPETGQYVIAHQQDELIVVYQAYAPSIANFAVANQKLGGSAFSYNRMSWIKPNFLWMMFRCGWASKENQERVLALWIKKTALEDILDQAVFSTFKRNHYNDKAEWQADLDKKPVRLQWDPDHDPYGAKLERRAVQLGLKGETLTTFGNEMIQQIEDITPFVKEQKKLVDTNNLHLLQIPVERIWMPENTTLIEKLDIGKTE
ncbi:MAG: DUF4291 domain-containing protein [Filimonas sp.]|nr:DUF4291 domain-containing protein [Filimonas sp.]